MKKDKLFGSCGHLVDWDTQPVWVRNKEREYGPTYSYMVLCYICRPGFNVLDHPPGLDDAGPSKTQNVEVPDDFQRRLHEYYETCKKLQAAKRNDYTAGLSPYHNYEKAAEIMGCSTGLAMLGRLNEKVVRLSLALKGNKLQVVDHELQVPESMSDSCRDISILAGLIALWLEDNSA